MGCFSFLCKVCGKAILSNSFNGQSVRLYLLKDGKTIEFMEGPYDSYGRVFDLNKKSIKWTMEWRSVCNLMFSENVADGIAAIHSKCYTGIAPVTRSKDDPNQGWGDGFEYFGNTDATEEF